MAYNTVNDLFKGIADAIRTKTGKTEKIATQDMPAEIESITTGGGDEAPYSSGAERIFYNWGHVGSSSLTNSGESELLDNAQEYIINHLKDITSASSALNGATMTKEILLKFAALDFSKCTNCLETFYNVKILKNRYYTAGSTSAGEFDLSFDLSSCTTMNSMFRGFCGSNSNYYTKLAIDFNGTTGKVTNFTYAFSRNMANSNNRSKYIYNINMDKCSQCNDIFACSTSTSSDDRLKALTFKGSFGGLSTSNSLTLKLPGAAGDSYGYNYNAFIETINSVSENTSGKTRIFSVPSVIYDQLTDEDIEIATSKGYDISSY